MTRSLRGTGIPPPPWAEASRTPDQLSRLYELSTWVIIVGGMCVLAGFLAWAAGNLAVAKFQGNETVTIDLVRLSFLGAIGDVLVGVGFFLAFLGTALRRRP